MKVVYACRTLDEKNLKRALKEGCTHIATNLVKVPNEAIPAGIEIIDALKYRIEGSWVSYNTAAEALRRIKGKFPALFTYRGVDFTLAYEKALYWDDSRGNCYGNLEVAVKAYLEENPDGRAVFENRFSFDRKIRAFASILKAQLIGKSEESEQKHFQGENPYLFLCHTVTSAYAFLKIASHLPKNKVAFLFLNRKKPLSQEFLDTGYSYSDLQLDDRRALPMKPGQGLALKDRVLLSLVTGIRARFASFTDYFLETGKTGRVIIMNASENTPEGHLLWEIQKQADLRIFNKMNGIKAPTANNAKARFHSWVVWDEPMKQLLTQGCQLDDEQFTLLPHLSTDKIQSHIYQDSLPVSPAEAKDKKVITFIDVFDLRRDKVGVLDILYKFLKTHPDYLLLYRPKIHKDGEYQVYLPKDDELKDQVFYIDYSPANKLSTLYDQLQLSDLIICIGSTVALEAKIAGTPVITYEQTEKSLLYLADTPGVKHVKTPEALLAQLEALEKKTPVKVEPRQLDTPQRYAQEIVRLGMEIVESPQAAVSLKT